MSAGTEITVERLEADPYPIYAQLRAEAPVCFVESVGLWLVTRWNDVQFVDKNPDLFTGETEPSTLNRTFGKNLLGLGGRVPRPHPLDHLSVVPRRRDRRATPTGSSRRSQRSSSPSLAARGACDLVVDFAEPLSARVLKQALGLEFVEEDTLRRWFAELAEGAANFEGDPARQAIADAASARGRRHASLR